MRWLAISVAAILFSAGGAFAQEPEKPNPPDEVKRLEGRWQVMQRVYKSSKEVDPVAELLTGLGFEVELANGKLLAHDKGKEGRHLHITMDPSQFPKLVDLRLPGEKDRVLRGIYWQIDEILVLAINATEERPRSQEELSKAVLLLMRRTPPPEFIGGR